ncbi:hypothetical protein CsatB_018525 [Cannabis sativa]
MGENEISDNGDHILSMKNGDNIDLDDDDDDHYNNTNIPHDNSNMCANIAFAQKLLGELLGTYFMIFAGCGSVAVNLNFDKIVTFPGICITWGLVVMVNVYALGHISGAHFNPAVTIAFASVNKFPIKQVPAYIISQVVGSTLACGTLRLMFSGKGEDHFLGTMPAGSNIQSFVAEYIVTFYLLFAISGICLDDRAIGQLGGIAVGFTVLLNVLVAGPISGASMNPARSLGPAIVWNQFKGFWIYVVAPILGAISGVWAYNLLRFNPKPVRVITKTKSFLKTSSQK